MDFLRRMVAGTRRRFEEEGYSLDLTYIIPNRIIAMSYPSSSIESLYRNPIDKVCLYSPTRPAKGLIKIYIVHPVMVFLLTQLI